ncbi:MAG: tyrosine-type recombinase/integrase [Erythrobacter sp.]
MGKLTDLKVRKAGPGIHGDGAGLYLRVKPSGARSWALRVQFHGRRQDIGLGGYPTDLSLSEAREQAAHLRKLARQGKNARAERDRDKVIIPTFKEAADAAHEELSKGWSEKNAAAFKSSLAMHAHQVIGNRPVDEISTVDVIAALSPLWTEKPAQAQKLRVRILQVLSFAKSRRWRTNPVPDARELRAGLAKQPKSGNFRAMPYAELPSFVADELSKEQAAGRLALLFTIFTAARSGEVRSAQWEHIDLEARVWNRPAELMKAGVAHRVTLNEPAIAILERAKSLSDCSGHVFPGSRQGSALSDMTLSKILRTAGRSETVHGFRSTFRDWAAEQMHTIPDPVAEAALAHAVPEKVVAAYKRTQFVDLRRDLMAAWGRFAAPDLSEHPNNVIELSAASGGAQ